MAFLGMRGTGDWATNERPENWRQMILFLYPNGDAPLTGILSMIGSEATDDPIFHWWTKNLPSQGGAITGIYTNADLSTAYSGDNYSAGQIVYVKGTEAIISEFITGKVALLRDASNYNVDTAGEVIDRVANGANSYIAVRLIENTSASNDLDDIDRALVVGNANEEGAEMPDALGYDPVEYDNYTQIFRNSLSITRTARKTRLRTGKAYEERKRETLELHSIEMEKALIWGRKYSTTGQRGKPKRFSEGLVSFITSNASDNVDDFVSNATYAGDTWLQSGEDWLEEQLAKVFRYGRREKLALVGEGAMLGLSRLARSGADINLTPMETSYGLKVMRWITGTGGTLFLKEHPLFSYEVTNRNSMLILEPEKIKSRHIDDTFFAADPQDRKNRNNRRDGTEEEFLTEIGWEYHHPLAFGYFNGVGLANIAS